jgi:hypothetical protein
VELTSGRKNCRQRPIFQRPLGHTASWIFSMALIVTIVFSRWETRQNLLYFCRACSFHVHSDAYWTFTAYGSLKGPVKIAIRNTLILILQSIMLYSIHSIYLAKLRRLSATKLLILFKYCSATQCRVALTQNKKISKDYLLYNVRILKNTLAIKWDIFSKLELDFFQVWNETFIKSY